MHSTTTALLETTNNWSINIDNGLLNGVLFIDLKKAFDTIDHEIILRKLANYAKMMFKSLNGLAPVYLQDLFSERHTDYHLRDSFHKLNLPKPRTNYLKRSFGYRGALLWNSLPESIRAIRSIGQFKKEINRTLQTFDSHSAIL